MDIATLLAHGEMTVHGRIPSSNATLLVSCTLDGEEALGIYKPLSGERPLWDFPGGLWRREVCAYELNRALGLNVIPVTVARHEGPFGVGSVQAYVNEDGVNHYFTLRDQPEYEAWFVALAAFDVVANNADRKSGHVLYADGELWGIDNGLCFHVEEKLRTVIWDFAGERLPEELKATLERFCATPVASAMTELLDDEEVEAMLERAANLASSGELPAPDEDRPWPPYPWPLV